MLLKVFVCLLFVYVASAKSVSHETGRFIIVLRDESTLEDIERVKYVIETHEGRDRKLMEMEHINHLIPMVFANVKEETVMKILSLPEVSYVERDQLAYMQPILATHYNTSKWLENLGETTDRYNLDIMNKAVHVCRNDMYNPPNDGTGADIYILDTGIKYYHYDFMDSNGITRAQFGGYDAINPDGGDGSDCNGHGSHCAGIAAGLQSGVATNANLFSIRVLGCDGSGTYSGIELALDYVVGRHNQNKNHADFVASIVSMSLGGGKSNALNAQVNAAVAAGVTVVTASGNDGADAKYNSPGSAGDNINVGAHSAPISTNGVCENPIESFSNWGPCVDVIAPGTSILSVNYINNYGFTTMTGTSMACPHVAGAVALLMKNDNSLTPTQVKAKICDTEAGDIDRSSQPNSIRDVSNSQRLYVPSAF